MGRDGRKSTTKDAGAGIVCLGTAFEAVVGVLTQMRPLRRECERLMARHEEGSADAEDKRRYAMVRLRLLMLESANRGIRQPLRAERVLADRSRLVFHAMLDHTDPFPEPQPS